MRVTVRPLHRQRLLPLLALFVLVPVAAALLLFSYTGRARFARAAAHHRTAAMLPGITVETTPGKADGLVITSIRSDSQASLHGMAVGDSIVAIDGAPILTLAQAHSYLQKDKAGAVELRTVHGRQLRDIRLVREGAPHEL